MRLRLSRLAAKVSIKDQWNKMSSSWRRKKEMRLYIAKSVRHENRSAGLRLPPEMHGHWRWRVAAAEWWGCWFKTSEEVDDRAHQQPGWSMRKGSERPSLNNGTSGSLVWTWCLRRNEARKRRVEIRSYVIQGCMQLMQPCIYNRISSALERIFQKSTIVSHAENEHVILGVECDRIFFHRPISNWLHIRYTLAYSSHWLYPGYRHRDRALGLLVVDNVELIHTNHHTCVYNLLTDFDICELVHLTKKFKCKFRKININQVHNI